MEARLGDPISGAGLICDNLKVIIRIEMDFLLREQKGDRLGQVGKSPYMCIVYRCHHVPEFLLFFHFSFTLHVLALLVNLLGDFQ